MVQQGSLPGDSFTFMTDAGGIITIVSPGAHRFLGYRPSELIGRPFLDIIAAGSVRQTDHLRNLLMGKMPFRGLAVSLAGRDGLAVAAEISGLPLAETGHSWGCHGIVRRTQWPSSGGGRDIEHSLQAELLLDLVCHDLNNMNQIEEGYLELTLQSLPPDGDAHAYLERCMAVLESSTSLIGNVQKLQQIGTGSSTLEMVDLGRILGEAVDQYGHVHGRKVAIDFAPVCGCHVMANGLLKDAFLNIIGNAIRHHPDGSPVITVRVQPPAGAGSKVCIVSIEDNGPGIPDEMKARLFNRFQPGQTATSGKGLGLYLVKTLVEGFHGTVQVEDRIPGDHRGGSRFVITLPVAGADGRQDKAE